MLLLNQGDLLLAAYHGGPLAAALTWRVPLTYLVPLLASYGSSRVASNSRSAQGADQ